MVFAARYDINPNTAAKLKKPVANGDLYGQLGEHLDVFVYFYNLAERLKALKGLTPYEVIVRTLSENTSIILLQVKLLQLGIIQL